MASTVALISRGYFPRELPPAFTTAPLARFYKTRAEELPAADNQWTEHVRHNLARINGTRRPLSIPNPRGFIRIAQLIEEHWPVLDAHFASQQVAISRPVVTRALHQRAIRPRFRLSENAKLRSKHWRGQNFVLKTDIAQFYNSIYTHSVPWALHGRRVSKASLKPGPGKAAAKKAIAVGDALDVAMRNAADGQTIGIPIGPDSSLVIAEILLTSIDRQLAEKLPGLRAFRYLDDYEAAFRTRADADEAQSIIEAALSEFELTVNQSKTYVLELPQPMNATWVAELGALAVRPGASNGPKDTIALFSRASELASVDVGSLKYVLQACKNHPVNPKMWNLYQGLVWSAVSGEPSTMPVALDLLELKAKEVSRTIRSDDAAEVIEAQILTNAPLNNGSEVVWALWAACRLKVCSEAQWQNASQR